jgi:hypothetical protein
MGATNERCVISIFWKTPDWSSVTPWKELKSAVEGLGKRFPAIKHIQRRQIFNWQAACVSVWDRNPSASKADWVGRQKLNSLDGSQ